MEAALGKVLFLDEAYRLSGSSFGTEALEEIVTCLTLPKFQKKLVVILAGYSDKMDELMEVNTGLRSRFTEILEFPALGVDDSLKLLKMQLINSSFIAQDYGSWKDQVTEAMKFLINSPHWANGRDIHTLSQKIHNTAMQKHAGGPLVMISLHAVIKEMKGMMLHSQVSSFNRLVRSHLLPQQARAATANRLNTTTSTKTTSTTKRKRDYFDQPDPETKWPRLDSVPRDKETSDEDWRELQAKKAEAKKREEELRRRRKYKEIQEQERKNMRMQKKLKRMGRCVAGYEWIKVSKGWRCAGGAHFVSDGELDLVVIE